MQKRQEYFDLVLEKIKVSKELVKEIEEKYLKGKIESVNLDSHLNEIFGPENIIEHNENKLKVHQYDFKVR